MRATHIWSYDSGGVYSWIGQMQPYEGHSTQVAGAKKHLRVLVFAPSNEHLGFMFLFVIFLRIGIPWDSSPFFTTMDGRICCCLFTSIEEPQFQDTNRCSPLEPNMAAFWRLRWVAKFPAVVTIVYWLVVSKIFYFHPYLGKIPNLTNIFQWGWNHQLDPTSISWLAFFFEGLIFVTSLTSVSHWFVFWHPFEATKNGFHEALWGINKMLYDLEIMFDSNLEKGNSVAKHISNDTANVLAVEWPGGILKMMQQKIRDEHHQDAELKLFWCCFTWQNTFSTLNTEPKNDGFQKGIFSKGWFSGEPCETLERGAGVAWVQASGVSVQRQ